jgi:hypothetical protein
MAKVKVGPGPPPDLPAHTPGVKSGNSKGNYDKQEGHLANGKGTARRSTGINASAREPIDPRMPNLMPG